MFKKDFVWGAAASSYQIEGAAFEDGKGLSIWDTFCKKPGVIFEGHTGDVACDHYHRYKEDVALMKEMGLKAYRLSLSWPRIIPDGTGAVNEKGIRFYQNLIDELLGAGITPYITLFHWDLPLTLYHKGGWMSPESPDWFANYARVVIELFSDKVKHYMTFNEPQVFVGLGCVTGEHAPGLKMCLSDTIPAAHNVMLAHGKAVLAMRKHGGSDLKIGYAPCGSYPIPATDAPADIEIARKLTFKMPKDPEQWHWNISWWSDPVILGTYPRDGLDKLEQYLPESWRDDLAVIKQPLDFYGQNIYQGFFVKEDPNGEPLEIKHDDGHPRTACDWPITPDVLNWPIRFLYERYKLPIYITENGLSCHDVISLDGQVHDPNRIDYMHRHLLALREAAANGADVAGYFAWSCLDNFEWARGYGERFGMIFVDFPTLRRIIKDSGRWYRTIIEKNGGNL